MQIVYSSTFFRRFIRIERLRGQATFLFHLHRGGRALRFVAVGEKKARDRPHITAAHHQGGRCSSNAGLIINQQMSIALTTGSCRHWQQMQVVDKSSFLQNALIILTPVRPQVSQARNTLMRDKFYVVRSALQYSACRILYVYGCVMFKI